MYVEKSPGNPLKGCSWIELLVDDIKRFSISTKTPASYTALTIEQRWQAKTPGLSSRGKSATKKFVIVINGESVPLRAHKALTISAVCSWLRTWAPNDTQLVTPGGRTHQLNGDKVGNQAHFIYFIFNEDSNAIKIGRAKNVSKRLQALQTSSPAVLELLKTIPVEGLAAAQALELALHEQFKLLRLNGEWFRADASLKAYVDQL
ncbi:MAG: GIY-YIG nuclease family protein [Phormidesmis sp. RL_2_1]|nr:GIY-YIG nuclease family protein [Phormidesmis sp. RL_2_1]